MARGAERGTWARTLAAFVVRSRRRLRRPVARARALLGRLAPDEGQRLFGLTVALGVVCGLVAVAFHGAIGLVTHLSLGDIDTTAGWVWIPWLLAVPTAGGAVAGLLLDVAVPNARGSGIPQVKVAFAQRGGRVRLRDAVGKFAVGALQIGTGSSLGREGPTVHICAGVADALGRWAGLGPDRRRQLIPVGAAAGIAAAFNAPIAAVTFTIEEVVGTLDQTLLSGIVVAAAIAAVIERSVLGEHPIFAVPAGYALHAPTELLFYGLLGAAAAVVSVVFTDALLSLRLRFRGLRAVPTWARPAIGGLVTGALAVVALLAVHSSGVTGGGYEALSAALEGKLAVRALVVLLVLKLVATAFSYGSGGAGGIFAPSLFLGGMLGGAVGELDAWVLGVDARGAFALVGMGAVFSGVIRAPMTSVLIIFEMTDGYSLVLPLMIANMVSYGLARRWRPLPIYEALLAQDGVEMAPRRPAADPLQGLVVGQVAVNDRPFVSFSRAAPADELMGRTVDATWQDVFPVVDDAERPVGLITRDDLRALAEARAGHAALVAADLMRPWVCLRPSDPLRVALERLASSGLRELPVVEETGPRVVGFIDEAEIMSVYLAATGKQRSGVERAAEPMK